MQLVELFMMITQMTSNVLIFCAVFKLLVDNDGRQESLPRVHHDAVNNQRDFTTFSTCCNQIAFTWVVVWGKDGRGTSVGLRTLRIAIVLQYANVSNYFK